MKREIKLAFVFIGTIIGAGLASGQEILQFFTLYGINGYWGIFLCCIIYILISVIIVNLCFNYKFQSYKELIVYSLGKRFGFIGDIMLTLFIFGCNTIMLSGGGAMLNEYLRIDKYWGILLMALVSFTAAAFSTNGVITINSAIVPFSFTTMLIMGLFVVLLNLPVQNITASIINSPSIKNSWASSAILYSSFNLMTAIGVICPMTTESSDKKNFIKGCIIGSIALTIVNLIINSSIIIYSPQSLYTEIPNLCVAKNIGGILPLILTLTIWLEMFSTEVGNLYSLSMRIQHSLKMPYVTSLLLILLASIPVSFFGFSNLIRLIYPAFGVVSLVFIVGCIIKAVKMHYLRL